MAKGKKTLLKEGTIRRFMKLAELDTLSSNFLNQYELEEQEEEEEELEVADVEFPPEEEEVDVVDVEATPEDMVQDLVTQIADVISNVTGVEVSVEGEEGEPEDVEGMEDLDDLAAEEDVLAAAEPDFPGDELAEDAEEELTEDAEEELEEDQGYAAKEDESLGMRRGKEKDKKQSMKARREDSYGKWGKRGKEDRGTSLEEIDLLDDEALVQEIAQRVAQRLMKK